MPRPTAGAGLGACSSAAGRDTLFAFVPAWIRGIDHSRGSGDSDEWNVS
ncbi:MAG TPA: hypothetical protein VMT46_01535 [Anaerolineaceae bacterium]|nr:hypothetical protein [Anaerolineaceae bacterium]